MRLCNGAMEEEAHGHIRVARGPGDATKMQGPARAEPPALRCKR